MRLGAATVVRLEGALAHEVLRRLQGSAPTSRRRRPGSRCGAGGGRCDRNRQARGGPSWSGWAGLGAMGMRKRSQTRSVNDTGAVERGSNRRSRRARADQNPRSSEGRAAIARRHAAEPEICGRLDCLSRACACRFSSSRSSPPPCTGCGQTCGQQGIVHRDTDGSKPSDPAHRAPARAESSREHNRCNRHDSGAGGIRWPRQASITRRSGSRRSALSTRWGCRTRSARSSGSAASSACSTRRRSCGHPTPSPRTSSSSVSASRSTRPSPVSSGTRSSSRCRSTRASRPTWG